MIIHAYLQVWNEALLMPYLLRHYGSFCDRIFIYDDGSTDGTREMVQSHPLAELRELGAGGVDDEVFLAHWHEDYKGSRGEADWVILADSDEFIYHRDIRGLLERYRSEGVTLPLLQGYNMTSDGVPTTDGQIYEELFNGWEFPDESKRSVFNPMLDVTFVHGRHRLISAPGAVENPSGVPEIALLHYNQLGPDYVWERRQRYVPRMSENNIQHNWGSYVFTSRESMRGEYQQGLELRKPLVGIIEGAGL